MKHTTLYIILVLTTLLAACSKEMEVPAVAELSDDSILFGAPGISVGELPTRSALNAFPAGSSFGVLGYCLAYEGSSTSDLDPNSGKEPWHTKKSRCAPHLFYKTKVTYDGQTCTYTGEGEPLRKWYEKAGYLYTFCAYYPYGECFTITPSDATGMGAPIAKFSIPFPQENGDPADNETENMQDLAIGDVPDAMLAAAEDVMRLTGSVNLTFYHLLTGINFKIKNYNTENEVVIHSLRLAGQFYRSIEVHSDNGYTFPEEESFRGSFRFLKENDPTDDLTVGTHDGGGLPSEVVEAGGRTLLLISDVETEQYFGDNRLYIEYSFMGETKTQSFGRPDSFMPVAGTIYTYELHFIGDAFVLNCVVDNNQNWEEGGDSDIIFQ